MRRLILGALCLLGCESELSYGKLRVADAGDDAAEPSPFCSRRGPLFALTDGDRSCSASGLHHAMCSCSDYVSGGSTQVEGSLALGGQLSAGGVRTTGALIIAGSNGAPLVGNLDIGSSLLSAGPVQGNHVVTVGGDARIAGDVRLDSLRTQMLTLPTGAALELDDGQLPNTVRAPVNVAQPCSCTSSLDVRAQIDGARSDNDNAAIALDPTVGLRTLDSARSLTLPCGRYYVDRVYAAAPITLRISGHVVLYVNERIVTEDAVSFSVDLDDDAELDLFVRGGITGAGPIRIGTQNSASRTRVYIGGDDSLFFAADASIAASLYAPESELVTQSRFELFGASLLRRFVAEQETLLHYDAALSAGVCTP